MQLQQERDATVWGVDLQALEQAMRQRGIVFIRAEAVDFDTVSLSKGLPKAVGALAEQLAAGRKTYVHCTAGRHRSPATCVAYLQWFHDMSLDEAYAYVKARRSCDPNREAVRAATYSLLHPQEAQSLFSSLAANLQRPTSWMKRHANIAALDENVCNELTEEERMRIQQHLLASKLEAQGQQPQIAATS